jgi:hypothetical protein
MISDRVNVANYGPRLVPPVELRISSFRVELSATYILHPVVGVLKLPSPLLLFLFSTHRRRRSFDLGFRRHQPRPAAAVGS